MKVFLLTVTFEDGCGENLRIEGNRIFKTIEGAKAGMLEWIIDALSNPDMKDYEANKVSDTKYTLHNTLGPDLFFTCWIEEHELEK